MKKSKIFPDSILNYAVPLSVILLSAVMLFARLGHYAIWDDEAMIALSAKGILRTGDTSVLIDHNINAFRNGLLVRDLCDRSTPPLSAYLAAASMSVFGENTWALRFPFALFGLATVALVMSWALKDKASTQAQILIGMGLLCNVSLILYSRQCRYYAPTVFFTVAVVWCCLHWRGSRRSLFEIAGLSVLLFAANYFSYVALYACIAFDYLVWGRKEKNLKFPDWLSLFVPQVILCAGIALHWNPLGTKFGEYVQKNSFSERVTLFFWNLRDMNQCEFCIALLLLIAAALAIVKKDTRMARGTVAILIYVILITAMSPQLLAQTSVADIRYLVPLIPLCIVLEVFVIRTLAGTFFHWAVIPVALLAFGTNLLNGGPWLWHGSRTTTYLSSIGNYVSELISPPQDPYTVTALWINRNVASGESIYVVPDYMVYPLIFHAPRPVYAWQLEGNNQDPQYRGLPDIHFKGRLMPDYIIVFGPMVQDITRELKMAAAERGLVYEQVAKLDCFWQDMFRPELFWRTFTPIKKYNRNLEAIYVFKHKKI
jgi:4-amino-4-deoxy-L-arabinose transferase-like glycosyltransferase